MKYLFLVLLAVATPFAQAEDFKLEDGKLVLRIYSATWCAPCKILSQDLMKDGTIAHSSVEGVSIGTKKMKIKGREQVVTIEKFEFDKLTAAWMEERNIPKLDDLKMVPFFELFDGKRSVFAGHVLQFAEQTGVPFEETISKNLFKMIQASFENDRNSAQSQKRRATK